MKLRKNMDLQWVQKLIDFGRHMLSEDGAPSFGRVGGATIILTTLFWVTYVVLVTHGIPDLSGPSLFLSTGTGVTYGATSVKSILNKKTDAKADIDNKMADKSPVGEQGKAQ